MIIPVKTFGSVLSRKMCLAYWPFNVVSVEDLGDCKARALVTGCEARPEQCFSQVYK